MRCPSCGADNPVEATRCQYCGSHLPQIAPGDERAAIERVKQSKQYAERNSPERHARLPKHHPLQKAFFLGFFVVFVGAALFIFVMMLGMGGIFGFAGFRAGGGPGGAFGLIPVCMSVVPLAMAAFGVYLFLAMRKKMQSIAEAPVEAAPVVVVSKRTEVTGGGNSSARTSYFVTVETEDGARLEHQAWDGDLYGRMAEGDAGILYLRADYALDFDRVTETK